MSGPRSTIASSMSSSAPSPVHARRYVSASSRESSSPISAITGLHGTHAPPPEIAVVPPIRSVFSSTVTRAPPSAATSAPVSPAAPLPITIRSVVVPSIAPATAITPF